MTTSDRKLALQAIARAKRNLKQTRKTAIAQSTLAVAELDRAERAYQQYLNTYNQTKKQADELRSTVRNAEVALKNEQLNRSIEELEKILLETLTVDDFVEIDNLCSDPMPLDTKSSIVISKQPL